MELKVTRSDKGDKDDKGDKGDTGAPCPHQSQLRELPLFPTTDSPGDIVIPRMPSGAGDPTMVCVP